MRAIGGSAGRRRARAALAGATGLALGGLGLIVLFWQSRAWVVPKRVRHVPPDDGSVEEVAFPSRDGVQLYGWLRSAGPKAAAIILCHGYGTSLAETAPLAERLYAAGFTTLGFDFRAHGRSGGRFTTIGTREVRDLLGAVDLLGTRFPAAPVGVYGVSMGGSVALQAAAEDERIRAVAGDCAFTTLLEMVDYRRRTQFTGVRAPAFHLSRRAAELMCGARIREFRPLDAVHRIAPRPVFLMHSECDTLVPPAHFDRLLERLPAETERWLIPGCGHAAGSTEHADEYVERLAGFFRRALDRQAEAVSSGYAPSRPDQS